MQEAFTENGNDQTHRADVKQSVTASKRVPKSSREGTKTEIWHCAMIPEGGYLKSNHENKKAIAEESSLDTPHQQMCSSLLENCIKTKTSRDTE